MLHAAVGNKESVSTLLTGLRQGNGGKWGGSEHGFLFDRICRHYTMQTLLPRRHVGGGRHR